MKNLALLSAVLLFCAAITNAQQYKNLDTSAIPYFKVAEYSHLTTFAVDSIYETPDATVFEFIKHLDPDILIQCNLKNKPGMMGPRMLVGRDSSFTFLNNRLDSIRMYPLMPAGSIWNCFESDSLNLKITAFIEDVKDSVILGDSTPVSYIRLMVKKMNGTPLPLHSLNQYRIIFSYQYGFVQLPMISGFPERYTAGAQDSSLFFCGYLKKDGSIHKGLTSFPLVAVLDYEIGDEIHDEIYDGAPYMTGDYPFGFERQQRIKIVFGKTVYTDSITYRMYIRKWTYAKRTNIHTNVDSIFKNIVSIDTITFTVRTTLSYRSKDLQVPGFFTPFDYMLRYSEPGLLSMHEFEGKQYIQPDTDSCWIIDYILDFYPSTFIKGIGGAYFDEGSPDFDFSSTLLYFKKGSTTWGTPLPPNVGIGEIEGDKTQAKLYPNPASSAIEITRHTGGRCTFSIYSIDGKKMAEHELDQASETIDVSGLANGLYFYSITGNEHTSNGKLLIRH